MIKMIVKEEYKYSDITAKIIGCAMKVHRRTRNGFQGSLEVKRIINNKYKQSIQSDKSL